MSEMNAHESLEFAAPITLTASGKVPTWTSLCYSGSLMFPTINGKPVRVVVDLAGLVSKAPLPIVRGHDQDKPVGHAETITNDGRTLTASGLLSQTNTDATEILAAAKNRFPWQASVGLQIEASKPVSAGQSVNVNGRTIPGPFILVSRSILKEISVVAIGGDADATFNLAAKLARGKTMSQFDNTVSELLDDNNPNQTAALDERNRISQIMKAGRAHGADVAMIQASIDAGDDTNLAELKFLRAARPQKAAGNSVPVRRGMTANTVEVLTAGLMHKVGLGQLAEKSFSERTLDLSREYQGAHMLDICRAALAADHVDMPQGRIEIVKAAFSTRSLTDALSNLANKSIWQGYNETPATWRSFAAIRSAANFKTHTGVRANIRGSLEKLPAEGLIPHAEITDEKFQWNVDTYAKQLGLSRQDIINDDLGLFDDASRALGRMAMRTLNDNVYETLLGNAGSFFHADHDNLITSALSIAGLTAAVTALMKQKDADNNDLDIRPAVLLVPPELADLAKQLLSSEGVSYLVNDAGAPASVTQYPNGNSHRNVVKLEIESRLSNTDKFATADANNWYLFGSPADMALAVGFLNGVQSPTVEYFGLDSDRNHLGVAWRVYFDFGSSLGDWRAVVKANVT